MALHNSIATALDPTLDIAEGTFPVASAIDVWVRDPPAVTAHDYTCDRDIISLAVLNTIRSFLSLTFFFFSDTHGKHGIGQIYQCLSTNFPTN